MKRKKNIYLKISFALHLMLLFIVLPIFLIYIYSNTSYVILYLQALL